MKAYDCSFGKDKAIAAVLAVGAQTLAGAARKAELAIAERPELKDCELVKVELTESVIL